MFPIVKFFAAVFYQEKDLFLQSVDLLEKEFSEVDYIGKVFPFIDSDYYQEEMGDNLKKRIISFSILQNPSELAKAKLKTSKIEEILKVNGKRRVNIDIGYLDLFKVVLASLKYRGNKIYLDDGVWADMTLYFEKGKFRDFPWTFSDFKAGAYDQDLLKLRKIYKSALNTTVS
ncbi:MAG: DUF4416 family protein [Proteobacteria bacterium]|nr:DUF4416 family protein [Pseudomonadota bacterium]